MNPKETVKKGYDALSMLYRQDDASPDQYKLWTEKLISLLPSSPTHILDIGCGCGVPVSRDLVAAGYAVTGIDISEKQIERAKILVPEGRFFCQDITSDTQLSASGAITEQGQLDAIVALYVLFHMPLDEQAVLMRRMAGWLKEGGYCLMTVGIKPWELEGEEAGWLGSDESVKMWWLQTSIDQYRTWAKEAGFEVIEDVHTADLVGGSEGHQLLLLRKPYRSCVAT
ncbi:hypothetical protein HYDPIDRAFT_118836 [Hydnomerulius pinastri MD-312]|uniref:Methyltransferase domain-containing protein n=1 Tax=Hydnomerulius pinastri MD-312 TaxID=994086 RepID=A0A0C9W804_9AGAM|nr:hypothetical protein HYDPIDRAFT_118836 [Hydnomerulius pinastri MD-312]